MTGTAVCLLCYALAPSEGPIESARFGYVNQPAYSLDKCPRLPLKPYRPQPGDIILYSDANIIWATLYALGGTGAPGHSGLVIRQCDGEFGVLEAGYNDKPWVRVVPHFRRASLKQYAGYCWIRQRKTPSNCRTIDLSYRFRRNRERPPLWRFYGC